MKPKTYIYNGREIPQATMLNHWAGRTVKLERILKLKTHPTEPIRKQVTINANGIEKIFVWNGSEYRNGKQSDIDWLLTFKDETKVTVI